MPRDAITPADVRSPELHTACGPWRRFAFRDLTRVTINRP